MEKLDYLLDKVNVLTKEVVELQNVEQDLQIDLGTVSNLAQTNQTNISTLQTNFSKISNNLSNPNLLINGDFRVNQRGQASYNGSGYAVDRWRISGVQFNVSAKEIVNSSDSNWGYVYQKIEDTNALLGKKITYSAIIDGVLYKNTVEVPASPSAGVVGTYCNTPKGNLYAWYYGDGYMGIDIGVKPLQSVVVEWVKLELGEVATSFNPKPIAEEFTMCQRFFKNLYANEQFYIVRASDTIRTSIKFNMRIIPTFTQVNTLRVFQIGTSTTVQTQSQTNSSILERTSNSVNFQFGNFSGLTQGSLCMGTSENLFATLDAEIY